MIARLLRTLALATLLAVTALTAQADPTGTFRVVGTNPDSGSTYKGTVTVTRTGQTYKVVWDVAGTRYIGTGLGAVVENSRFLVGPADKNDIAISIGYVSGKIFGMAMYFLQDDGTWQGVWTYAGSSQVAGETWYPE